MKRELKYLGVLSLVGELRSTAHISVIMCRRCTGASTLQVPRAKAHELKDKMSDTSGKTQDPLDSFCHHCF